MIILSSSSSLLSAVAVIDDRGNSIEGITTLSSPESLLLVVVLKRNSIPYPSIIPPCSNSLRINIESSSWIVVEGRSKRCLYRQLATYIIFDYHRGGESGLHIYGDEKRKRRKKEKEA